MAGAKSSYVVPPQATSKVEMTGSTVTGNEALARNSAGTRISRPPSTSCVGAGEDDLAALLRGAHPGLTGHAHDQLAGRGQPFEDELLLDRVEVQRVDLG